MQASCLKIKSVTSGNLSRIANRTTLNFLYLHNKIQYVMK
jgi:hypothetical protein